MLAINLYFGLTAVYRIYDVINPLSNELEEVEKETEQGNFTRRIENPRIINDKILSRSANVVNHILDQVIEQIEKEKNMASVITTTVSDLSSNAEELNASWRRLQVLPRTCPAVLPSRRRY